MEEILLSEIDSLVKDQFIPFRQKILGTLRSKHPVIFSVVDALLANKANRIGFQVTDQGRVVGEYTFHLKGIAVERAESGNLSPEFHHPLLGVIKPCAAIEKDTLQRLIKDDGFVSEPLTTLGKYLPGLTIRFL
jgi:hypothetical protein